MIMISTCTKKSISFDILGPSDIFGMEMSVISANELSVCFLPDFNDFWGTY